MNGVTATVAPGIGLPLASFTLSVQSLLPTSGGAGEGAMRDAL